MINPYSFAGGDKFDNFVCKWNAGGSTVAVGISTLDYIIANGNDEVGIEYGFKFRSYSTTRYSLVEDGSDDGNVNLPSFDTDTEFKLTYDGTTMKWFVDGGAAKKEETVTLSGTYYLWTNNNRPVGQDDTSIQCQYNDTDAEWTGIEPSNWTVSNPSVTKVDGSSWGTGIYATAQSSTE